MDINTAPKGSSVKSMFGGIAERYDLANHLLSGGMDFYWRKELVKQVKACTPSNVVDLACGSGDVTFALRNALAAEVQVSGLDFCQPMLDQAEEKKQKRNSQDIKFILGDCLDLPYDDNSIDALTIAFGFRNFEDPEKGLSEMLRVLKPGGSLFILEFTQPIKIFRPFYYFYLKNILPFIAGITTGKKDAYEYLCSSIEAFPDKATLCSKIKNSGFNKVTATGYTFSTVAIHRAEA